MNCEPKAENCNSPVPRGLFVGLATVDLLYSVEAFPAPNTKIAARSLDVAAGGPATNAAIAFAHLGGEATLATPVGLHPLAGLIRAELASRSVSLADLAPTAVVLPAVSSISVNARGERNVVSTNGSALPVESAEPDPAILSAASVLLVDGHHAAVCIAWARAARTRGIPVVFDGGSFKPGTAELAAHVDIAICSADFHPPGCSSPAEVFAWLRDCGVSHAAITHGSRPVEFASGSVRGSIAVPSVQAVDTTGAGDVFHGAFCFFLASGLAFAAALERAAAVAAHSCRYPGTREWMLYPQPPF